MKLSIRSLCILAILLMSCLTVRAQQKSLTLDECVDLALENNIHVRTAMLAINQAEQRKKEMFTSFFPSIDIAGSAYMLNRYIIDVELFDIPILQYLKRGTVIGINAIQPIFAGGRLVNGNKLAKVGVDVSKLEHQKSKDEVRLTTEKYYWDVVILQAKMKTIHVLDTMINRLMNDVTVAVKAGVKMQNDLLQVQLKQNDISADRLKVDHLLNISQQLLAQYIGVDEVSVKDNISMDSLPAFPFDLKKNHQEALLSTSDYQLMEKNVRASKLNKRLEVGKSLPQLAVGGSLMSHTILDGRQNLASLYATVSIPITSWWGGSHAIKRLKYAEELAKEELDDNSQLLLIQMENDWNTIVEAYEQLFIAQKSVGQSKENLRINSDCYRAGTVPLSELLEAQSLYQQASNNFIQAFADYNIAITTYQIATSQYD